MPVDQCDETLGLLYHSQPRLSTGGSLSPSEIFSACLTEVCSPAALQLTHYTHYFAAHCFFDMVACDV
jgi:hypothetical protein